MNLLLSEKLPLRTSQVLGNFAESKVLPHRYGNLTSARFSLIRLTDSKFFVADHPMQVTSVFIDGQLTNSWEARLETDGAGNTWTVVAFSTPIPLTSTVSACGIGKLDPVTGSLIDNPADVMTSIAAIGQRTMRWGKLRAECSANGLTVALSLDAAVSMREAIDGVAGNVGAIWTPDDATLWPTAEITGHVLELDRSSVLVSPLQLTTHDSCDVLRIGFDREDASGRPQKHLELTATPKRFGGIVAELTLPYVRSMTVAEKVGRRLLQRMGAERYKVPMVSDRVRVRPGQWLRLINPVEWPFANETPVVKILGISVNYSKRSAAWTAEYLRAVPSVTVTGFSLALPDTIDAGVEVAFKDGIATFTVYDKAGKPLAGAAISFDNSQFKLTDAKGQASFQAERGVHIILVSIEGFSDQELEITL